MAMKCVRLGVIDGSLTHDCTSEEKVNRTMTVMYQINLREEKYDN